MKCLLLTLQLTFTFFQIARCDLQTIQLKTHQGNTEEIHSNVRDLSQVSNLIQNGENLEEICAGENSVWVVFNALNYSESNPNFEFRFLDASIPNINCGSAYSSSQISFRHLGNLDTNISTLSLYKLTDYHGIELSFTGNSLDLPFPEFFASFAFTGPDSWELFPEDNAGGGSRCLRRPDGYEIMAPFGIPNLEWKVKKVVRGCGGGVRNQPTLVTDNTDQDSSSSIEPTTLNLRGGTYPRGDIFIDGSEVRLSQDFKFFSSRKTWNSDWQLFSGRDFDGESICIDQLTRSFPDGITVGSMKLGCGHEVGAPLEELPEAFKPVEDNSANTSLPNLNVMLLLICSIQLLLFCY